MQPALTTKGVVGCAMASALGEELCSVEVADVVLVGDEEVSKGAEEGGEDGGGSAGGWHFDLGWLVCGAHCC